MNSAEITLSTTPASCLIFQVCFLSEAHAGPKPRFSSNGKFALSKTASESPSKITAKRSVVPTVALQSPSHVLVYMIFIYYFWVSSRCQRSANLCKNRNETAIYKQGNNTQYNTKTQNTQNSKQKYKTRKYKNIIKNTSRVISK